VWQTESNVKDKILFASPKDYEERNEVAGTCVRKLGIKFPAVIDGFDNKIESAYTGWPERIYLIDRNGRVAYKSKPGPFGFKPEELEGALKKMAGTEGTSAARVASSVASVPTKAKSPGLTF